jgi:prepilin-type N-terminal cleavage/methylation domain-containing protein
MNIRIKMKKAFSMIELIFVIVVLGIIASIGSEVIAQTYKNSIYQKANSVAATKAELAVEQIANRLNYAVPWSIVAKNIDATNPEQLGDVAPNDLTPKAVEWIGIDGDSFEATATPGWSGYCDAGVSTAANCPTPGSSLTTTDEVIKKLGGNGITDAVVIFNTPECQNGILYSYDNMGLTGANTACAFSLTGTGGGNNLNFAATSKIRADAYDLAWSAYTIVPTAEKDINGDGVTDVFDLELRYGYQPWNGGTFLNTPNKQIIATNVSVFKVAQNSLAKNDIRIKICIKQPVGTGSTDFVSICKEKAVIR